MTLLVVLAQTAALLLPAEPQAKLDTPIGRRSAFVRATALLACSATAPQDAVLAADACPAALQDLAIESPTFPTAQQVLLDTAGYLSASEAERLDRILRRCEQQTGWRVRVLTRSRTSAEWTRSSSLRAATH